MSSTLVSVIIPNYNHAFFLRQRIESVLRQTYHHFEIIILDDNSNDDSVAIINEYKNEPLVSAVVINEANRGNTFLQWQKGVALAKGEIIWIAESDDFSEPVFLETLMHGFYNNPNCVIAYCQSYCVDENDSVLWQSKHPRHSEYVNGNEFFKKRLVQGCTIFNVSMALFKKEFFYEASKNIASFKMCGDWLFWINMSAYGDIFISGRVLNYFRRHSANVGSKVYTSGLNFIEDLKVLDAVKRSNRTDISLLNNVVFIKYNNFLKKREKFKSAQVRRVMRAFESWFGSATAFNQFIFKMRMRAQIRKVKGKIGQLFHLQFS